MREMGYLNVNWINQNPIIQRKKKLKGNPVRYAKNNIVIVRTTMMNRGRTFPVSSLRSFKITRNTLSNFKMHVDH